MEMIENLDEGLSAYSQNDFIDLCRGPHIPHFGIVQAFKLMKTSGAYWRADKNNPQLTRIYGISFPDKKLLKSHLNFLEEAAKRDQLGPSNLLEVMNNGNYLLISFFFVNR